MNKNNLIILVVTVVVFIGGAILFSNYSKGDRDASSIGEIKDMHVEEDSFDFGSISMKEGTVSHEFVLQNTGSDPITLGRMYSSCMCTKARIRVGEYQSGFFGMIGHGYIPKIKKVVEPGKEAIIEVVFDPAAHGPAGIGMVERVVTLEDLSGEKTTLQISATVTL